MAHVDRRLILITILFVASVLSLLTSTATVATENVIIPYGSPEVVQRGTFQEIDAYLSQGGRALRSAGSGRESFTFQPTLPSPGYYRIYAWWPLVRGSSDRVEYRIGHRRGLTFVEMNQQVLAGQWNSLGIFELSADGSDFIEVAEQSRGPVLVDALRLELLGARPPPLAIETKGLPLANVGQAYTTTLSAVGRGASLPVARPRPAPGRARPRRGFGHRERNAAVGRHATRPRGGPGRGGQRPHDKAHHPGAPLQIHGEPVGSGPRLGGDYWGAGVVRRRDPRSGGPDRNPRRPARGQLGQGQQQRVPGRMDARRPAAPRLGLQSDAAEDHRGVEQLHVGSQPGGSPALRWRSRQLLGQ